MAESEDISLNVIARTRRIILDALDVAADYRRDRIETCPDCRDGRCPDCVWRLQAIAEYERVTEVVAATGPPEPVPREAQRKPRHDPRADPGWDAAADPGTDDPVLVAAGDRAQLRATGPAARAGAGEPSHHHTEARG